MRESESLMEEARQVLQEALEKCLTNRNADWSRIKLVIRDTMNEFIMEEDKEKTYDSSDYYGCSRIREKVRGK